MISAFGVEHEISKSFVDPFKIGAAAKPARLLSGAERKTIKNRIVSNKQEAVDWGIKPGNSTPLPKRGSSAQLRGGRKVFREGPAFGSTKQTTQWNAKMPAKEMTDGAQRTPGGRAWKTNTKKGSGVIHMGGSPSGSYKGTPNANIHSHEQAHLAVKRNPVRARERFANPARSGGEEGRADFGIARAEPYKGSPEFRAGYERVQGKMAAAKKRKGQNVTFHEQSRSWRYG